MLLNIFLHDKIESTRIFIRTTGIYQALDQKHLITE